MARLLEQYRSSIRASLGEQLNRSNPHSVPELEKIIVSMGVGAAATDRKRLEEATGHLAQLTGQRPQVTRARKAISGFRLRQGMEVGCRVTLRGKRMYELSLIHI